MAGDDQRKSRALGMIKLVMPTAMDLAPSLTLEPGNDFPRIGFIAYISKLSRKPAIVNK
jgi:hypothetical protein